MSAGLGQHAAPAGRDRCRAAAGLHSSPPPRHTGRRAAGPPRLQAVAAAAGQRGLEGVLVEARERLRQLPARQLVVAVEVTRLQRVRAACGHHGCPAPARPPVGERARPVPGCAHTGAPPGGPRAPGAACAFAAGAPGVRERPSLHSLRSSALFIFGGQRLRSSTTVRPMRRCSRRNPQGVRMPTKPAWLPLAALTCGTSAPYARRATGQPAGRGAPPPVSRRPFARHAQGGRRARGA